MFRRRTKGFPSTWVPALTVTALLTGGCVKPRLDKRLDESYREIEKIQRSAEASSQEAKTQGLSWNAAIKLMSENNLGYEQARNRLTDLEEDRSRFYWQQLSPRLLAIASLSSALGDVSNLSRACPKMGWFRN